MGSKLSEVSKPVKIGGAVGIALVVILLAVLLLKPHQKPTTAVTAAPLPTATPKAAKQQLQLAPGLPPALHQALEGHGVVVAVLAGDGSDGAVATAREAAKTAHVGFAVLNVADEMIARDVATLVPGLAPSAMLVVQRPGTVAEAFPGYSDTDTVAQAAADTKSGAVTATPAVQP